LTGAGPAARKLMGRRKCNGLGEPPDRGRGYHIPGCFLLISMFLVAVFVIICTDIGKDPPDGKREGSPPTEGGT
jgi:hypothetical protein